MHSLLEQLATESSRLLIWGLVPRAVGLIFLIAYGSLWFQILPLLGSRGISPVGLQLNRLREDLPLFARLRLNPSLLWLAHGDVALRVYIGAGMLGACAMIVGGRVGWWGALCCWAIWLSLHFSLRLVYPWDTVLLEAGFLCLFAPAGALLPQLSATALPHPLLPFIFHLLLFRLLLGFGKMKFIGIRRGDWNYTRYFLINMPLCTPLGWRFSRLPNPFHKLTLAGIAFVELVCPVLVLIPGPTRLIGGAGIVAQMIGIQLTGNFGYFNWLTAALCISTLDVSSSLFTALADPAALVSRERLLFTLVAAFIILATPVYLIFNSWFNYGFLSWPAWERLRPGPLRAFLAVLRFFEPLHPVNAYGVFHAQAAPPQRWVTVVEGSDDGVEWKKYRYRYTMTDDSSRPRYVAPHHPRLDHQTFYDAAGVDGTGYFQPLSFTDPYLLTPASVLDRTMQRLLEPEAPGATLFAETPFVDGPPRFARVALYRFTAMTAEEQKETNRHWKVMPIGLHIPPTEVDERVWKQWVPPPELFHGEAPLWRRRARVCKGINSVELRALWEDFLPFVKQTAASIAPDEPFSWSTLPTLQKALRQRYQPDELRAFQLTLGRLTMVLMARFDAVFSRPASHFFRDVVGIRRGFESDFDPFTAASNAERVWQALAAWPHGALRTRFHVWLVAQWAILNGEREGWSRLAGPDASLVGNGASIRTVVQLSRCGRRSMSAAADELRLDLAAVLDVARNLTIANGMFLEGVVNYDVLSRHASRLRVLYSSAEGHTKVPTGLFPGVFETAAELCDQPSLCMMYGWGENTQLAPLVDPPPMVFGDDCVWRELNVQDVVKES
ncbi:MAG TPA: lipase maturation factor family protein [Pyrinomonadaceae bacterium]